MTTNTDAIDPTANADAPAKPESKAKKRARELMRRDAVIRRMPIHEIVKLLESEEPNDRLRGEYYQLRQRNFALRELADQYNAGEFELTEKEWTHLRGQIYGSTVFLRSFRYIAQVRGLEL